LDKEKKEEFKEKINNLVENHKIVICTKKLSKNRIS
jgi:hypothetical protein